MFNIEYVLMYVTLANFDYGRALIPLSTIKKTLSGILSIYGSFFTF